jgi:ABC-type uncharacterized transport system fused permease/ATPase subunit
VLGEVKTIDVVRYIVNLVRDLVQSKRLKANPKDYVRRLLGMVWPDMSAPWGSSAAQGQVYVLAMLVASLVRTSLQSYAATLVRRTSRIVYQLDVASFRRLLGPFLGVVAVGSATSAVQSYAKAMLTSCFREKLTARVHTSYFKAMTYYHIAALPGRKAIKDADTRITKDIASVSGRLSTLVSLLVQGLPPAVWFTYKLWRWRGFNFAILPHVYLFLAYEVAQRLFPKNIGECYRNQMISQSLFQKVDGMARRCVEGATLPPRCSRRLGWCGLFLSPK